MMLRYIFFIFFMILNVSLASAQEGGGSDDALWKIQGMEDRMIVGFEPVVIPITTDDNRKFRVRIMYGIEVFDKGDVEEIVSRKPKITGEILQALYQLMYKNLNQEDHFSVRDIDVPSFNAFLQDVIRPLLPEEVKHELYVFQFSFKEL